MQSQAARAMVASRLPLGSMMMIPSRNANYNSYVPPDKDASPVTMHTNPFIAKYRKRPSPDFEKQSTGLTGLFVSEKPHHELSSLYGRILHTLTQMPDSSSYRQATQQIVEQRLDLVKKEGDIRTLETKIGMGQIEEVIEQAQYELKCARSMLKHKVWEGLVECAPADQWRWPI